VILTVYLDESGTHDGSPVTIMGGILAKARQWEAFEKNFGALKKRHQFQIFHMKKFKRCVGDFKGWDEGRQHRLIDEMSSLSARSFTEGVTVTLDNSDYEATYKGGENPRRMRLDSKYGLCFRYCLMFFSLEGFKRKHRGRYPKMHFVLESGHKNAGDALRIFNEEKKMLESKGCDMFGEIAFADKDKCDPLMIADFLAHKTFLFETSPPTLRQLIQKRRDQIGQAPSNAPGITHLNLTPKALLGAKSHLLDQLSASGKRALERQPS